MMYSPPQKRNKDMISLVMLEWVEPGRGGFSGGGMNMDDIFSQFGDIFGGGFGGFGGGQRRRVIKRI